MGIHKDVSCVQFFFFFFTFNIHFLTQFSICYKNMLFSGDTKLGHDAWHVQREIADIFGTLLLGSLRAEKCPIINYILHI